MLLSQNSENQNLQVSSSHDICTSFSLKSRGRGTLGWAFARKTEALSVSATVLGKLPALRRAKSSPFVELQPRGESLWWMDHQITLVKGRSGLFQESSLLGK